MSGEARPRGRLRRADCSAAGISRSRRGKGFTYVDADGGRVEDPETLARIRELAIPPAWDEVWICPDPFGHIQATGIDAAGRKQYLYHEAWQRRAAARKFETVREFATALPRLRRQASRDLAREGVPRERALACAVRLLDLGFFRIGGELYAETNESYGVATIRREHVSVVGGEVVFDFPAKSGQRRVQSIRDREVRRAIEAMRRRRSGPDDLLAFRERDGWQDVRSDEVNEYIQEAIGERFSAKDFRTWHGTVLAAVELAAAGPPSTKGGAERAIREAVKRVAERLGNTPAVCRRSYIDPKVLDCFRSGGTIDLPRHYGDGELTQRQRSGIERRVLDLIG
jgi:DNA topoisomerase IB